MLEANYIYPTNWDGVPPEGAGHRRYVLSLVGKYDADEVMDGIQVVDLAGMKTTTNKIPDRMVIEKIEWTASGMLAELYLDRDPVVTVATLGGQGELDWKCKGGFVDPRPAGSETGDLMLNMIDDGGANPSFNATITFRLKAD